MTSNPDTSAEAVNSVIDRIKGWQRRFRSEGWLLFASQAQVDARVITALAAERDALRDQYTYIGKDGKAVLAKDLEDERDKWRDMDTQAATHVETVIAMRTGFTGDAPYVGWKGLGLALTEALDERDALKAELAEARNAALDEVASESFEYGSISRENVLAMKHALSTHKEANT